MKIFVTGATGVLGRHLVPLLTAAGHEVTGLTRSQAKVELLRNLGAEPVVADARDSSDIMGAVRQAKPEIVVHELTSIRKIDLRIFDRGFAETNHLRREGTDHLMAAAQAAGARRFVAQSFAGRPYAREEGSVKTEEDALDPTPPPAFRQTLAAIRHLESAVAAQPALEGLVLRYGSLYGPGTAFAEDGWMASDIRKRRVPIIGGGTRIWSFIHIDDAARFTLAGITRGKPGIYNIVDDDPAPVSQWLPALAEALGAKPPRRIPAWIARFMIGDAVMFMTSARARPTPNLLWPSWRDGFRRGLGDPSRA